LNVITVYFNGDINAKMIMRFLEKYFGNYSDKVFRLLTSLYGLKQAGRIWALKFRGKIKKHGFISINANIYIFKKTINGETCIIALYVNDIIIATERESTFRKIKKLIASTFNVINSELISDILNIRVNQQFDKGLIIIN